MVMMHAIDRDHLRAGQHWKERQHFLMTRQTVGSEADSMD
jgi:hypothetical protein